MNERKVRLYIDIRKPDEKRKKFSMSLVYKVCGITIKAESIYDSQLDQINISYRNKVKSFDLCLVEVKKIKEKYLKNESQYLKGVQAPDEKWIQERLKRKGTKSKRGSYNKSKNKSFKEPKNYFRTEHENKGYFITWADAIDRGGNSIYISYKIAGVAKQFRSPRFKSSWMDGESLEFARKKAHDWKTFNNNSLGKGKLIPLFYRQHRDAFFLWLNNQAGHSTIQGYNSDLISYVFPFFVEMLKLKHPRDWDDDSITRWEAFLNNQPLGPGSRNRKRTALNRYLRFLKQTGIIKRFNLILFEPEKRASRETMLPGQLPEWSHVVDWIRNLPPGRYRFIMAVCAAFGTRISEACAVEKTDFYGEESVNYIDNKNDYVRKIKDARLGALFLEVREAEKHKISKEIIKVLGKPSKEPKTGPYTACCTSWEMAILIDEMLQNNEHLEATNKTQIERCIADMPQDHSPYKFHEYRSHDYRRLNITLSALDLDMDDRVEICCMTHGHSDRTIFLRYFQWGLVQRRDQNKKSGSGLKIFKVKNS